jgi:hypothetical protein
LVFIAIADFVTGWVCQYVDKELERMLEREKALDVLLRARKKHHKVNEES